MSPPSSSPPRRSRRPDFLAPRWHTALLIGVIVAVALTGALMTRSGAPLPPRPDSRTLILAVYGPMIVVQWGLVLYVCRVGRPPGTLLSLLGERPRTLAAVLLTAGLALAGWVAIHALDFACLNAFPSGSHASIQALLPHTLPERLTWGAVAASAGFGEEVAYRGYLQTQLTACARGAAGGILLQAVLFGIAHGEQGAGAMIRVAIYGLLLGVVARWRRGLWPGILCHVAIDLTSGLIHV